MAVVYFPAALTPYTGGRDQLTIDAPRVKELIAVLVARFPGIEPHIREMAVAIDGDVRPDAAYETLLPLSEIYFVPKIAGG